MSNDEGGFDFDKARDSGKDVGEPPKIVWKHLPLKTLLKYRDEIDQCLPPKKLSEINLEEEMLLQYHALRALYNEIVAEESIPANQKAQVGNSVTSSLDKLTSLQTEIYTVERYKRIENTLIRVLNKLPEEAAAAFLAEYRLMLEDGQDR